MNKPPLTASQYRRPVRRTELIPPQSESRFQTVIVQLARTLRWTHIYHPWSSIHSASGWPDLFMVRGQRAIAAELKTDRGRVTVAQQEWQDALAQVPGIETYVWRPSDFQEITRVLR